MVLAVILVPNIDIPDSQLIGTATGVMIIVKEISIGLAAGLIMTIWFSAAALRAKKLPRPRALVLPRKWILLLARRHRGQSDFELAFGCLFLSLDAHLLVLSIILKSYEISPSPIRPTWACLLHRALRQRG